MQITKKRVKRKLFRAVSMTKHRIKIIDFCKKNSGKITKAQIMNIINNGTCSCSLAYEISKDMVNVGILTRNGKCKFLLSDKYLNQNE